MIQPALTHVLFVFGLFQKGENTDYYFNLAECNLFVWIWKDICALAAFIFLFIRVIVKMIWHRRVFQP